MDGKSEKEIYFFFVSPGLKDERASARQLSERAIPASQSRSSVPASKQHELKQLVAEWGVSAVLTTKRGDYSSLLIPLPIRKLSCARGVHLPLLCQRALLGRFISVIRS